MLVAAILVAMVLLAMDTRSPFGKRLHRMLVETPVAWAHGLSLRRLVLMTIALAFTIVIVITAPELVPLMGGLADAAMMEILIAAWLVTVTGNLKGVWRRRIVLASQLARIARYTVTLVRRARPRSRRKPGEAPPPRPDDVSNEPVAQPNWGRMALV